MGDPPRIEELRRRVHLDPASIAFAALAEEYRRLGRLHEAVEACRKGLQRHPTYLSARVTLGRALAELGQPEPAATEFEQVVRAAPENLAARRGLADVRLQLGDPDGALAHLRVAAQLASQDPGILEAVRALEQVARRGSPAGSPPLVPALEPSAHLRGGAGSAPLAPPHPDMLRDATPSAIEPAPTVTGSAGALPGEWEGPVPNETGENDAGPDLSPAAEPLPGVPVPVTVLDDASIRQVRALEAFLANITAART